MTIYEGWEMPQAVKAIHLQWVTALNVGKIKSRVDPSDTAKTAKIGLKFTGPYQFLDTSTGEMRQTMPTLSRDEIRLQAGLLKHIKLQQKEATDKPSRVRRTVNQLLSYL